MTDNRIRLRDGQSALFGYGSLISVESIAVSLGHPYEGPFVVCALEGWRRSWNVAMPNRIYFAETPTGRMYPEHILYLNVKPEPGTVLNGILFVVNREELEIFDRREWIYSRIPVTDQLRGAVVSGGNAYLYVGKPHHIMSDVESASRAAIRASYLKILEAGFQRLGDGFRGDYERSSDPVPKHLVIDDQREP